MKLNKKYLALGFAASLLASGGAYAATQVVTADLSFQSALTLTSPTNINFGILPAMTVGNYTIDTAGVVSGGLTIGGAPAAGVVHIVGGSSTISVQTTSYGAANGGVVLSAATCSYDLGVPWACGTASSGLSAPGAGKDLKVGATAAVDGTQASGAAAHPTLTVTVIYG